MNMERAAQPLLIMRWAPWLLVAVHLPFVIAPIVFTITGLSLGPGSPGLAIVSGLVAGALQLRHSLAASKGERPRGWVWTFLLLLVTIYGALWWLKWNFASIQTFAIVSAAMLLPRRLAMIFIPIPVVVTMACAGYVVAVVDHETFDAIAVFAIGWGVFFVTGFVALYGAVRLVRLVDELYTARAELAESAIGRERVRVARDLHDLLGQSLSAVSLKGDLAIRLLPHDSEAARAEVESLTQLARSALRDVRAITRDEHAVSLRAEIDAAAALLSAAGVAARIDVDLPDLARPVQDVLAWAVREGTTNMLRHSEANTASITVARRDGFVSMEIINDGVRAPAGTGNGLVGLVERARAVSGSASVDATRDGRFRLLIKVPEETA